MHVTFNLFYLLVWSLFCVAAGLGLFYKAQKFCKKHFG